jgi:hypothetical protein
VADTHDREWLLVQVLDSLLQAGFIDQAWSVVRSLSVPEARTAASVMVLEALAKLGIDPADIEVEPDDLAMGLARGHAQADPVERDFIVHSLVDVALAAGWIALAEALAPLVPEDARALAEEAERAALALHRVPRTSALAAVVDGIAHRALNSR